MKIIKLMLVFYTDNTQPPRLETLKQTVSKRFKQAIYCIIPSIIARKYPFIEFLKAPGK